MQVETTKTLSNYSTEERREFVNSLLKEANSSFITIEFTKKDGSNRVMNIQQAALANNVVGEAASESAKRAVETRKKNNPNLIAVYDVQKHDIRSVNADTVKRVTSKGVTYVFV